MTTNGLQTKNRRAGFQIGDVTTKARKNPNRTILHGVSGWGKTSFAAQIPGIIFLMVGQETGLETLMNAGEIRDDIPHFREPAQTVNHIEAAMDSLITQNHNFKYLAIDAATGVDAILAEKVCREHYEGNWARFWDYGGDQASKLVAKEWETITRKMDEVIAKGTGIFLISHSRVVNFKNPEGPDYERWESLRKHQWEMLTAWSDMVLFGGFEVYIEKRNKRKSDAESKGKASGGSRRILYTQRHAAFDAKNRHGLPAAVSCGNSAKEAWENFCARVAHE